MNKMKNLEFGFCEKCEIELNYGYCPNQCNEIDIFSEAKYCGKTIRKIEEYLFNTAEFGNNINEDYLKQTIRFLNNLKKLKL